MIYHISYLNEHLVFIKWQATPTIEQGLQFLDELHALLDKTDHRLYFLSDLRNGYIQHPHLIRRLSQLADHPHFGGGTAFSHLHLNHPMLRLWKCFTHTTNTSQTWPRLEDALDYLESLQPGVTAGVEWQGILH